MAKQQPMTKQRQYKREYPYPVMQVDRPRYGYERYSAYRPYKRRERVINWSVTIWSFIILTIVYSVYYLAPFPHLQVWGLVIHP